MLKVHRSRKKPKSYVMTTLMNIKLTTCLPCSTGVAQEATTQDKMLNDLKIAQDYYKEKLKIECLAQ